MNLRKCHKMEQQDAFINLNSESYHFSKTFSLNINFEDASSGDLECISTQSFECDMFYLIT